MSINPDYYRHKTEPVFKPRPILDENKDFVIEFEEKGISNQTITNMVSYLFAKFELWLDEDCKHLLMKNYKYQI